MESRAYAGLMLLPISGGEVAEKARQYHILRVVPQFYTICRVWFFPTHGTNGNMIDKRLPMSRIGRFPSHHSVVFSFLKRTVFFMANIRRPAGRRESSKDETKGVSRPRDILDMDFDEIDRRLLGPRAWEKGKVARLNPIAPVQGSPFLARSQPIKKMLKRFSSLFWR